MPITGSHVAAGGQTGLPNVVGGRYSTRYWDAVRSDLESQSTSLQAKNPNRRVGNPKPLDPSILTQGITPPVPASKNTNS